jgi:hypothetical protein
MILIVVLLLAYNYRRFRRLLLGEDDELVGSSFVHHISTPQLYSGTSGASFGSLCGRFWHPLHPVHPNSHVI